MSADHTPQLVMIGFFPSFVRALDEVLPSGSLTVIEDPDIYRKKPIARLEGSFDCLSEVRLAAYQQADEHLAELSSIHEEHGVVGILPGLEYAVEAAAAGAEALGLPGLGVAAAGVLRDKLRLRESMAAGGMPVPRFRELHGPGDLERFLAEVDGELVLKPANRQASLGVRFLRPGDDVVSAWKATVGADEGAQVADRPMRWRYLAEERLVGPEVSVEALVMESEVIFQNITAKTTANGDHPVELGHVMPAPLGEATSASLTEGMRHLIAAAGVRTGILCAEWIITDTGPVLVECAGRCPGDNLMELMGLVYGGDFFQHVATLLRGTRPDVDPSPRRAAAIRFLHAPAGRVTEVAGREEAAAAAGVEEVVVTAEPGRGVNALASNWDRQGHVVAVGADPAQAMDHARAAADHVRIVTSPAPEEESTMPDHVIFVNLRPNPLEHNAALHAAHRLGLRVLLIADTPADVPSGIVTEQVHVDTYDVDAVVRAGEELALRHSVVGVVTWSDRDVIATSRLAERLSLPGLDPRVAQRFRNKHLMRSTLADLPEVRDLLPRFARVTSREEARAAVGTVGLPAVLKPTGAAGSIGIFEIHDEGDLDRAVDRLSSYLVPEVHPIFAASEGEMILEEYLTGSEHSVEGYVHGGEVTIAGITDKTTLPPFHLEIRQVFPSQARAEAQREMRRAAAQVVSALGLTDGVFHLECKWDGRRVRLIEVAARIGGDHITSHLIPLATDEGFYENTVRVAVGRAPVREARPVLAAGVHKFAVDTPGVFQGFSGLDRVAALSGVEHILVDRAPGSAVRVPPEHYMECLVGAVIVRGSDPADVHRRLDEVEKTARPLLDS